ncbi:type II toxin-antitoxin system Phd/YefM family antitoxin [Schaedlerella sp.]|jgi:hypothetical protein|uniref:type II toxin-antitoxin system Phd/YefM family antitoxin n=1 Tax=Schaedlerella sp. TaxID=2676057 RepID=UPI002635381D|nr:type II toxin-antitoxin system Phd/YefM family antitoxin [uncultured Schaedlerella sp.]
MNIRPCAAIRQNYNEIADLCRKTAEPISLTKNGGGDLVVMDIETYNRREKSRPPYVLSVKCRSVFRFLKNCIQLTLDVIQIKYLSFANS